MRGPKGGGQLETVVSNPQYVRIAGADASASAFYVYTFDTRDDNGNTYGAHIKRVPSGATTTLMNVADSPNVNAHPDHFLVGSSDIFHSEYVLSSLSAYTYLYDDPKLGADGGAPVSANFAGSIGDAWLAGGTLWWRTNATKSVEQTVVPGVYHWSSTGPVKQTDLPDLCHGLASGPITAAGSATAAAEPVRRGRGQLVGRGHRAGPEGPGGLRRLPPAADWQNRLLGGPGEHRRQPTLRGGRARVPGRPIAPVAACRSAPTRRSSPSTTSSPITSRRPPARAPRLAASR